MCIAINLAMDYSVIINNHFVIHRTKLNEGFVQLMIILFTYHHFNWIENISDSEGSISSVASENEDSEGEEVEDITIAQQKEIQEVSGETKDLRSESESIVIEINQDSSKSS